MTTSSTKKQDPMLACPDWCDLEEHDQCEMLRGLRHSRDVLTMDAPASLPSSELRTARVAVDVVRNGFIAPLRIHLGVGELAEGSAALTIEQAAAVIQALQDAIDVVEATS